MCRGARFHATNTTSTSTSTSTTSTFTFTTSTTTSSTCPTALHQARAYVRDFDRHNISSALSCDGIQV